MSRQGADVEVEGAVGDEVSSQIVTPTDTYPGVETGERTTPAADQR